MAGAATVALTYTAELKDLKKKLKEIPDLSAAEVREAIKSMNKAVKAGEKHASKTAKAAERAARESARATREGFKGIVELAGFSGDKVDKLSTVLEAVSVPAGAAAAGVGAVAVAMAAASAAAVGVAAGMVGVVRVARDLVEEVQKLEEVEGFGISPASIATIERANLALDGLVSVGKQGAVILGAEFAPAVEAAAVVVLKLSFAALDMFQAFADGGRVLVQVAEFVSRGFVGAFTSAGGVLFDTVGLLGELARATGNDGLAASLADAREAWIGFTEIPATAITDIATAAIEGLDSATSDYDGRVEALIGRLAKLKAAEEDGGKSAKALAAAQTATDKARAALIKTIERQAAAESDLAGIMHDIRVAGLEGVEAQTQAVEDAYSARIDAINRVAEVTGATDAVWAAADAAAAERARGLGDIQVEQAELAEAAIDSMVDAVEDLGPALDAMPSRLELIGAVAKGAFDSVAGIAGGVTGALEAATGGAVDLSVGGLLGQAAEGGGAQAMVDQGLAFVNSMVANLPLFLDALILAAPELIHGLVGALPELIEALVGKLPVLAITMAVEQVAAIINNLPAMIKALARGIVEAVWRGLKTLFRFFRDFFKEIRTLGRAKTKTFGDTPGPIRVPAEGMTAAFAPGDIVVASRTREGAAAQLGAPAPATAPAAVAGIGSVRLDIVDGHVGLDRIFRRNIMGGGALSPRATTGQVPVYNRGR